MKIPPLLKEKNPRILFLGRIFGFFANRFLDFAIPWMVYDITDSAILAGLVLAIDQLGPVVLSIPSGVFIEKVSKKYIAVISDFSRVIVSISIAILIFLGLNNIWIFAVFVLILGVTDLFFGTAYNLLLMRVVGKNKLEEAFNLTEAIDAIASSVAPAMAGIIFVTFGPQIAFLLTAIFFTISFITIYIIPYREPAIHEAKMNKDSFRFKYYINDIFKGIKYIFNSHFQKKFLFIEFIMGFVSMSMVLALTILAQEVLNLSAEKGSFLLTAMGFGAIFGVIILEFMHHLGWKKTLPLSLLTSAIGLLIIAFVPNFYFALLGAFILDMGLSIAFVVHASAHQINTDETYLARVNTSWVAFDGVSRFSSRIITGALTDLTDIRVPILLFSALLFTSSKVASSTKTDEE